MIENNKEIFYFMDENFASLEKKAWVLEMRVTIKF